MRLSNDIWDWLRWIGRGFAAVQILKKVKLALSLEPLLYFDKSLHTHYCWHDLDRGIAQEIPKWHLTSVEAVRLCRAPILKKWKWPNWVDYCDETSHTHWYWQDVAQDIVKCHLGLAEALPRFKFWQKKNKKKTKKKKQWNWPYLLKLLNILIKLCIYIAIDVS